MVVVVVMMEMAEVLGSKFDIMVVVSEHVRFVTRFCVPADRGQPREMFGQFGLNSSEPRHVDLVMKHS